MESLQEVFMKAPSFVDVAGLSHSLWLIIALPLLGAFICGVFGRMLGRANTNLVACASVGGSFVLSLLCFWVLNDRNTFYGTGIGQPLAYTMGADYGRWFGAGSFAVNYGLVVDHLSGTLLLVITGVGLLIHIYSTSYMEHDEGYWRYFAYLNLFVAMMLTLVLGDNMVLTFVGWEGVGMCSYLLIGFWYTDAAKAWAGRKAFITNRIGDFAFIIGMMLLTLLVGAFQHQSARASHANFSSPSAGSQWARGVDRVGPLNYAALEELASVLRPGEEGAAKPEASKLSLATEIADGPLQGHTYGGILTTVLLLFLLGAAGKSAQLPLYVWLPDAMAGPTPVSALIHAATMVTAGVYLFCRISYLLVFSPPAMAAIGLIGGLTALFAALIAFAQDDIKKVLAYSTVSQLGFMFMAVGLGLFWAAVLHLVTHAFFKACLFLGAGSVMHGNGDETDIKKLGGLRHEMPWTWATFAIATLAITGVVPFSGFFSKDSILHGISETTLQGYPHVNQVVWGLGLVAALCTAFYMTRLYVLTFEGKRAKNAKLAHAHESAWPMTLPLALLATLSIVAALYGVPSLPAPNQSETTGIEWNGLKHQTVMENFLGPVFHTAKAITEEAHTVVEKQGELASLLGAYGLALVIALLGCGAAAFLYLRYFPAHEGQAAPRFARTVRRWAQDKFYVDELYGYVISFIKGGSRLLYSVVDTLFIDTLAVRGTAWVTARTGAALRFLQTGDTQSYAAVMAVALLLGVGYALFKVL